MLTCVCHEAYILHELCRNCIEDGSVWSPDACLQGLASNHPMLLRSKVVVVSVGEKANLIRQVSDGKVSASKPLMTHRNAFQLLSKRAEACTARISVGGQGEVLERCEADVDEYLPTLKVLQRRCMAPVAASRPRFVELVAILQSLQPIPFDPVLTDRGRDLS